MDKQQIEQLRQDVERLKAAVGLPDDDWRTMGPALKAMGIGMSTDWLRKILKRADYAAGAELECSLVRGQHFSFNGQWMVNATADTKRILLNADGKSVLPDLPKNYAA
ncbi:MAG: hypothetical protein AAFV85_27200 [Cyanobacteria bacterium J06634_6]